MITVSTLLIHIMLEQDIYIFATNDLHQYNNNKENHVIAIDRSVRVFTTHKCNSLGTTIYSVNKSN